MTDRITDHFAWSEFACHDGTDVPAEKRSGTTRLCVQLEVLRAYLDCPIRIVSGYRTAEYNKRCGGARDSQHMHGRAADIQVAGMTPTEVYHEIEGLIDRGLMTNGGIGRYDTFVHFDVRGYIARWDERKTKTT